MLKEKAIDFFFPLGEIGFWVLMDDKLKCNIIPKLWEFGALRGRCHLIPKAISTGRLLGSLHSAALLQRGGCEGEGGFAMDCLISRTLKCDHQIKRLGLRSTVPLRGGENILDLHKWGAEH